MTATALIAEDEPLMRERLREKLAELWPECTVVGEAADGDEALALFDAHAPDVAFLDVRMPGRSGLDIAALIGGDCHVVFITAYDQYAINAFATGAADYLLKPVETERLAQTVERVKKKLAAPPADLSALVAELKRNAGATRNGGHGVLLDGSVNGPSTLGIPGPSRRRPDTRFRLG